MSIREEEEEGEEAGERLRNAIYLVCFFLLGDGIKLKLTFARPRRVLCRRA